MNRGYIPSAKINKLMADLHDTIIKGDKEAATKAQALEKQIAAAQNTANTALEGASNKPITQIEYRDSITVPAVGSLLGTATTIDVTVTWPTPFADANYTIVKPQTSAATATLIGKTDATVKSKTPAACVIAVTTTALLAAGNVTLSVLAYRKS